MKHISKFYPGLYIFILQDLQKFTELEIYMNECKKCELDSMNYCFYVHGFLIPWLQQEREATRLEHGK